MKLFATLTNITKMLFSHAWRYRELKNLGSADVLLICADGDRSYQFAGKKYAHLLDSVNELLISKGLQTVTIADHYAAIYGTEAFGNVVCINGMMARASFRYAIIRRTSTITKDNNPIIKTWDKIVKKVKPRLIIGIQPSFELCIAAKQNNIWIADLQHGALSDTAYYGLKYRSGVNQMGWPDCVLSWDNTSTNWLEKNLDGKVTARMIGNPWFLRFIEDNPYDKLVKEASAVMSHQKNGKPVILVTLQWGQIQSAVNHEIGTSASLVNFIKSNEGKKFTWWLRIHPVQLRGVDGQVFLKTLNDEFGNNENVSWTTASENPLPLVLQHVDLHITLQSAVTIEAGWFGIKTALLHPRTDLSYEYFKEQVDQGMADIISPDETAITNWIAKQLKKNTTVADARLDAGLLHRFINEVAQKQVV
jgi:hypothetical protein